MSNKFARISDFGYQLPSKYSCENTEMKNMNLLFDDGPDDGAMESVEKVYEKIESHCSECEMKSKEIVLLKNDLEQLQNTNVCLYQEMEDYKETKSKKEGWMDRYIDKITRLNEENLKKLDDNEKEIKALKITNEKLIQENNKNSEHLLKQTIEVHKALKSKTEKIAEILDIDNAFKCSICMERNINCVLVPCGHQCCDECRKMLQRSKKPCHICRNEIKKTIKTFIS